MTNLITSTAGSSPVSPTNFIYNTSGSGRRGIWITSGNNNYLGTNEIEGIFDIEVSDSGTGTTIQHRDRFAIDSTGQLAAYGIASLIVNQAEAQDILTASASGTTRMTLRNDGDLWIGGALNAGGASEQAYNFFSASGTSSIGDGVGDLYIEDEFL